MKKRIIVILLIVAMIATVFSGCGSAKEEEHVFEEQAGDTKEQFGDEENRKSLVICMDIGRDIDVVDDLLVPAMNTLTNEIKWATGMENVTIEMLPAEGVERETALSRLKTEIMAGAGPDVFIMSTVGQYSSFSDTPSALFNFPQKNMEAGLFLPLDDYMENNTRFTDWSIQNQTVLNAGRTDEGQVVVPLTYTFPLFVYPKDQMNLTLSADLTMQDLLNDPDNTALATVLYCAFEREYDDPKSYPLNPQHLACVLGQLADYETEELLFTEEELLDAVDTMTTMLDGIEKTKLQFFAEKVGYDLFWEMALADYDTEMSLVPIYSMDGGVTATVTSFAAVNRNTKYPEESFTVIDYLMQERTQTTSEIYSFMLDDGVPLQDDLCQEAKPTNAKVFPLRYFSAEHYEEFTEIKKQITAVNFRSELDLILESILDTTASDYFMTGEYNLEGIPEAYAQMKRMVGE